MTRRTLLTAVIVLTGALAGNLPAARLPLEEVLRSAVATAKIEEARLELARSNLHYLEALNKTRIELRPSLGLFAFSNPVLLAANLGSGLLFNRRTAPGPAAMQSARFDALAAEVSAENLKVRVQLEAARGYFDLLGKQQAAELALRTLDARRARSGAMDRMLEAARITSAEKLSYEQELLELETVWLNAETERKSSAARLALLVGMPEAGNRLAVTDVDPKILPAVEAVPDVEHLLTLALQHRGESKLLTEKLEALEQSKGRRRGPLESVSTGYSFITNKTGTRDLANDLLGGNTGRAEITLNIPLRKTGEREALDAVTAARVHLLQLEMQSMESAMRLEVTELQDAAESSVQRERLALRRLELAKKSAEVVRTRAETGLAPLMSAWASEQAVLTAETSYLQAEYERKSDLYALLVVCGVDDDPAKLNDKK